MIFDKIFGSIKEAAEFYGVKQSTLRAWLNPKNPNKNRTMLRYL